MGFLSRFKHKNYDGPTTDHEHQWGVWGDIQEQKYECIGSRFGTLPGTNIAGYPWVHLQVTEIRQTRYCIDEQCHFASICVIHRNERILRRFSREEKIALENGNHFDENYGRMAHPRDCIV